MTRPTKILVIDDDQAILRVFTRILNRKGYDVTTADTGNDARKKLESKVFDAALIDVRLPDVEGINLLPFMHNKDPRMVKNSLYRIVYDGF
jgi:two-component system NtrC family response regulator